MANNMLYNLERPLRFDDVQGNLETTELVKGLLKRDEVSNAHFIFSGTPGTGKTTVGRILARAINCTDLQDGEPCNKCDNCTRHIAENYADYMEVDATQYSKVDDAKRLVEIANQYPVNPKGQRVILLDEAHVLSNEAFDKFLKLLESGDVKTTFIFCTTDLHLFRPAIVSRCFGFEIKPLASKGIAKELMRICDKNGFEYDRESINRLANHYAGKPRDAVKTLDLYIKSKGSFKDYSKRTQESLLLEIFKLAYYNKVEEYISLSEELDSNNLFRNTCRMINEVYLHPTITSNLIDPLDVESFKTLIDNQSLKVIMKDVVTFKPTDVYSLLLLLATVTEMGIKLSKKVETKSKHLGRRFIDKGNKSSGDKIVSMNEEEEVKGVDIDSIDEEIEDATSKEDLLAMGFNKQ